jgi:hypothetical protein
MTRPTITQSAEPAAAQSTPAVRNQELIAHRLLLVRLAQLVGAGRAVSLPGLSPAIAVLVRLLGEIPASLQLTGIVILTAALLVVVSAPALRARPRLATANDRFNGRHDRRHDDNHQQAACARDAAGLASSCGRRSALLTAAP